MKHTLKHPEENEAEMRDVTPGQEVKLATVASLQPLANFDENKASLAAQIRADMDSYERMSRDAALIALRVGLRLIWIRDNAPHGGLLTFMAEHFADKSQRTLYNYIRVADQFLTDAGLRDKATFKLTGKALAAVAPICEVQLELFSDPEARLEGALKKLVKWLGDRGLAEIYREMEAKKGNSLPPRSGKGGRPAHDSITPAQRREAAVEWMQQLGMFHTSKAWEWLEDAEMAELDNLLDRFSGGVREILRARREAAEAKRPRNRKGEA